MMESGDYFDCSASHQVAVEHGYSRIDQLMSHASGLRYTQTSEGYQASCVADASLCDPQLLLEEDSALTSLLGKAYARNSTLSFSQRDAAERISLCTNAFPQSARLTISDDGLIHHAALYAQFAAPFSEQPFLQPKCSTLTYLQSPDGLILQQQVSAFHHENTQVASHGDEQTEPYVGSCDFVAIQEEWKERLLSPCELIHGCSLTELHRDEDYISQFYPLFHAPLVGGNKIIAVIPLGWQPIIDCHVPVTNNYKAGGVYHHNSGKTYCGAMEGAMHLTGRYPEWYKGVRYGYPILMVCGGVTNVSCRDIIQKALFGDPLDEKQLGTGSVPIDCVGKATRKVGVTNAYDSVQVKHFTNGKSDGMSTVYLRAYEQGFKAFMGITGVSVGWLDEEPPQDVWSQFLRAGLAAKDSMLYLTLTPEEGMTKLVSQFINDLAIGQSVTTLTWDDALHFTEEVKIAKLAAFPEHEREMRRNGSPLMGAGLVFPQNESMLAVEPFEIPRHWPQLNGIDFGWDHPFAGGKIAWDRDSDCIYVTNEYRESKAIPAVHAMAIRAWGEWVPVSWPHDGLNHEKGTGEQLRDKYVQAGLSLLPWKATNPPQAGQKEGEGGNSVEAALLEMYERMESGRFKVFKTCTQFFEELRMYHRDTNGKLVKSRDDLLSAIRYAVMMVRHARTMTVTPRKQHTQKGKKGNWK